MLRTRKKINLSVPKVPGKPPAATPLMKRTHPGTVGKLEIENKLSVQKEKEPLVR